jgi:GTP-binding protein
VAAYPFTTLFPSVGIVEYSDLQQISVADIPGLIEGAHEDRGLGHDFLRHIERTKVLLFVLDIQGDSSSSDGVTRSPRKILQELLKEIRLYDKQLLERPKLVFANKYDLSGKKWIELN